MIRFRSCPRCKGDLRLDWDDYGMFLNCLQCGYYRDLPDEKLAGIRERKAKELAQQKVKV